MNWHYFRTVKSNCSKMSLNRSLNLSERKSGATTSRLSTSQSCSNLVIQLFMSTGIPPNAYYAKYTIPQREIVAGEAFDKSCVSNSIFIWSLIWIISLFIRHKRLLSSRTVFIFSIHCASTGPSKTIHRRWYPGFLYEHILKILPSTPSENS